MILFEGGGVLTETDRMEKENSGWRGVCRGCVHICGRVLKIVNLTVLSNYRV